MGFDRQDLLRQFGFTTGDIVPLATLTPASRDALTTSTTFKAQNSLGDHSIVFDRVAEGNFPLKAAISVRFEPGVGETMTGRFRTFNAGNEIVSITGESGVTESIQSGFTDFTPTNQSTGELIQYQHKVDTGANSSRSVMPTLYLGVEL